MLLGIAGENIRADEISVSLVLNYRSLIELTCFVILDEWGNERFVDLSDVFIQIHFLKPAWEQDLTPTGRQESIICQVSRLPHSLQILDLKIWMLSVVDLRNASRCASLLNLLHQLGNRFGLRVSKDLCLLYFENRLIWHLIFFVIRKRLTPFKKLRFLSRLERALPSIGLL